MFGLFKQRVSKGEYGSIIAENALQYLTDSSRGVDTILKAHEEVVRGNLVIDNNFEKILSIQLASCIATGELSLYSMDRNGISVYEVRNGFIKYIEACRARIIQEQRIQLEINPLKISQDITRLISSNDFLAKTGEFYCDNGFSQKDIYGQIAVYVFNLATREHPQFQNLIYDPKSMNGALQLEMSIDRAFRFVYEMYKSYKII